MRIKFLGPIDRVTGSCTWLQAPEFGFEAVVDCGLVQGEANASDWNEGRFPFEPRRLTHVFLTHAHVDHCGLIPMLYRLGYRGLVYCTRETAELARLLMMDCVRNGAPYTGVDVKKVRFNEPAQDRARNSFAPVHTDVFLKWYRTGHIYGAVSMAIYLGAPGTPGQRSIIFSGDLSGVEEEAEQLTLNRAREIPFAADYAVVESTYGDRVREPEEESRDARLSRLAEELRRAAEGGILILPCFAVDRTQQVLLDLHEVLRQDAVGARRLLGVQLLLHAKMATRVNAIYARAATRKFVSSKNKTRPWWLGKGLFHQLGLLRHDAMHERAAEAWIRQCLGQPALPEDAGLLDSVIPGNRRRLEVIETSETANLAPGTVLVTGGGMCDGGAVHGYLAKYLHRPEITVGFTGYLGGNSHAARLFGLADLDDVDRSRLPDTLLMSTPNSQVKYPLSQVRARFVRLGGYSGHADQASLVRWVFGSMEREGRPVAKHVFVQHGQSQSRRALVSELLAEAERRGTHDYAAEAPGDVDWFNLATGKWDDSESRKRELARLRSRMAELEREEEAAKRFA